MFRLSNERNKNAGLKESHKQDIILHKNENLKYNDENFDSEIEMDYEDDLIEENIYKLPSKSEIRKILNENIAEEEDKNFYIENDKLDHDIYYDPDDTPKEDKYYDDDQRDQNNNDDEFSIEENCELEYEHVSSNPEEYINTNSSQSELNSSKINQFL